MKYIHGKGKWIYRVVETQVWNAPPFYETQYASRWWMERIIFGWHTHYGTYDSVERARESLKIEELITVIKKVVEL